MTTWSEEKARQAANPRGKAVLMVRGRVPQGDPPPPPRPPVVIGGGDNIPASVAFNTDIVAVAKDGTTLSVAVVRNSLGSVLAGYPVTFSIDHEDVATVNSGGLVTYVATGLATLRATVVGYPSIFDDIDVEAGDVELATLRVEGPLGEGGLGGPVYEGPKTQYSPDIPLTCLPLNAEDEEILYARDWDWQSEPNGNPACVTLVPGGAVGTLAHRNATVVFDQASPGFDMNEDGITFFAQQTGSLTPVSSFMYGIIGVFHGVITRITITPPGPFAIQHVPPVPNSTKQLFATSRDQYDNVMSGPSAFTPDGSHYQWFSDNVHVLVSNTGLVSCDRDEEEAAITCSFDNLDPIGDVIEELFSENAVTITTFDG